MGLSIAKEIRSLTKRKNITMKELSRRLGKSNQNMANKLRRDNFSVKELEEIAEVVDCNLVISFIEKKLD